MPEILTPLDRDLRLYQMAGVRHLMKGKNKLLLDDPGIGKTAQAIVAFNSLAAKKVLIICPSGVRYHWDDEVFKWSLRPYVTQVITKQKTWLNENAHIFIISYKLLESPMIYAQLKEFRWPVMVLDEVHFCKNMKAVRTKKILSPKGLFQNAIYTWGLSGSLMPNTPIDLYPVMRTIGHKQIGKFTDWFKFTGRFCGRFRGKWGWDVSGAKNIDDLSRRLFKTGLALRRAKEDVIEELPSRQYRLIRLEPDTRAIGEPVLWNDDLKKTEWCSGSPGLGAGELAELRAAMALAKLDMVITYIKEQLETERKLVIFTWHRVVTETLVNTFQNSVAYYGGMNANQKEEAKSKFTHGNVQLFIANIASAGTGIDGLQRVCSHAIFVEIPWTYAEVMQATDRLWRIGQENHVLADILVVRGSNEQYILKQVFKKEKFFRDLLLTSG